MKKIILLTFILLRISSFSQEVQWLKSKPYSSYVTSKNLVCADQSGNIFIAGEKRNGGGVFLAKYDSNGNEIWNQLYPGYNSIKSICADPSGNLFAVILIGKITIDGVEYTPHGNFRQLIVKFDPSGNTLMVKETELSLNLAKKTSSQGYLIGSGWSLGTVSLENNISLTGSSTTARNFIGKFNLNAECLWAMQDEGGGNSAFSNLNSLLSICDWFYGDSIVLGKGTKKTVLHSINGSGGYIAMYDTLGELIWAREGNYYGCSTDADGNMYAFLGDVNGGYSAKLVKYDKYGKELWQRTQVYSSDWYKFAMKCDPRGNIFISGGFRSSFTIDDTTIIPDNSHYHSYVIKIDSSGARRWIVTNNGSGLCGAKDIEVNGNEIYVTGDVDGSLIFGAENTSENNGGVFLLKVNDSDLLPQSTFNSHVTTSHFNVFPNPSENIILVSYRGVSNSKVIIAIKNQLGQQILKKEYHAQNELNDMFDLSKVAKGIYFIELVSGETREVKKIIIE